ncbi:hypothetical protein PROSTU_00688 [Providencia stuartii ATCC 25827]|uniref:Uncharacterized protein n=1 Tax=Providencia stuartii ATCC 25827 TaxID=471874 RepID=A0AA86YVY2_PROST|nr:hypothetical protein PROSTU_00688 [Providencia stuartii ATCC 25827]
MMPFILYGCDLVRSFYVSNAYLQMVTFEYLQGINKILWCKV